MKHNEAEFYCTDEPGEVTLTERDIDLMGPLWRGEITIARAREIVAARRADERDAREEAQEKYRADAQEAFDDEFGQ
jgi:hypothetical protein